VVSVATAAILKISKVVLNIPVKFGYQFATSYLLGNQISLKSEDFFILAVILDSKWPP
jgi:hypothetical protein